MSAFGVWLGTLLVAAAVFFGARALAGYAFRVPGAWLPFRRIRAADGIPPSPWARPAVTSAGPIATYVLAAALIAVAAIVGGHTEMTSQIGVIAGQPAAVAGLEDDDRIAAMNGTEVQTFQAVIDIVHAHPGQPIEIVVDRRGELLVFTVTPDKRGDEPAKIGLTARGRRHVDVSVGEAIVGGFVLPARFVVGWIELFTGRTWTDFANTDADIPPGAGPPNPLADIVRYAGLVAAGWWPLGVVAALVFGLLGWRRDDDGAAAA